MMINIIFQRVRSIIAEELQVSPNEITLDANLRGHKLRADSLDLINLVMAFAQQFDVEINDTELQQVATFGDVVYYLERYTNPQLI